MKKKAKNRRVYPLVNPINQAISGAQLIPLHELDALVNREREALKRYSEGVLNIEDWQTLNDCCNVAAEFAEQGIGPEVLPALKMAQDGLIKSCMDYKRNKLLGAMDAGHLIAMHEVINYQDLQRRCVSRGQFRSILQRIGNKIRSGHPEVVQLDDVEV